MNQNLHPHCPLPTKLCQLAELGVWRRSAHGDTIVLSSEAATLYQLAEQTEHYHCATLLSHVINDDKKILRDAWEDLANNRNYEVEFRVTQHDGRTIWLWEKTAIHYDAEGHIEHIDGVVQNITRHREKQENLICLANHDRLTELPNRGLLAEYLSVAIPLALRNNWTLAVLFIDLDRFKQVNDELGHDAGDELLRQVAKRMKSCLRESDMAARQGGDEFIVVLQNAGEESDVGLIALYLIEQLSLPFDLHGKAAHIGASVGVSLLRHSQENAETLFHNADLAMYQAKAAGRQTLAFFDPAMQSEIIAQRTLENDLRRALERNEFELYYQPIYHLSDRSLHSVEALLRWRHPEHGLIGAEVFLAVAETCGIINAIGRWAVEECCRQLYAWQRQGYRVRASVNLSNRQIPDGLSLEWLEQTLLRHHIPPNSLTFEVAEATLLRLCSTVRHWLYGLEKLHISLALDHFGTGHGSLSLLHKVPLSKLKIDKSLCENLAHDQRHQALIRSIVDVARNMQLATCAEAVEQVKTLDTLNQLGCHLAQGYCLSAPLSALEMTKLLRSPS